MDVAVDDEFIALAKKNGALYWPTLFVLPGYQYALLNTWRAMRRAREIGAIAPGRLADFVLLDADPLTSVDNLSRIYRVVKDGRAYDPDELIRSIR